MNLFSILLAISNILLSRLQINNAHENKLTAVGFSWSNATKTIRPTETESCKPA